MTGRPRTSVRVPVTKPCKRGHTSGRYLSGVCAECATVCAKEWRVKNPVQAKISGQRNALKSRASGQAQRSARRHQLRKYHLSENDYLSILAEQDGGCGICGTRPEPTVLSLGVDHDHTCCDGPFGCELCVRGLLCTSCNTGLGTFRDRIDLLRNAIKYIQTWKRKQTQD